MTNTTIETPSGKNENTENFPVEKLIRAELRPHVMAYYHFARAADDISDNPLLEAREKIERLDAFAAVLTGASTADIPSAKGLRESLKETGVTAQHGLDLLTAFKRDATKLRYENWEELMDYCRYSASPVGRYLLDLHGVSKDAWPANDAMCNALQVINHIQDCADDYREMDRVYLPLDIVDAKGAQIADLSGERLTPALRLVIDEMLVRTSLLLDTSRPFAGYVSDWHLKTDIGIIQSIAESLTRLLMKRDPLCDNVKLTKPAKIYAAARGIFHAWI